MGLLPHPREGAKKNPYEVRARYKTACAYCGQSHGKNQAGLMVEHYVGEPRELCMGSAMLWSEHKQRGTELATRSVYITPKCVDMFAWRAQRGDR